MEIKVFDTSKELGKAAAVFSAQVLNRAIAEKGKARLLMSTGASQFDTIEALRDADVEWDKVEMNILASRKHIRPAFGNT